MTNNPWVTIYLPLSPLSFIYRSNCQEEKDEKIQKKYCEQSELLRAAQITVQHQTSEIEDMKSLLAAREADHRRDLEHRYTLDSPKLEELFQSKITSLVREHTAERREHEQK